MRASTHPVVRGDDQVSSGTMALSSQKPALFIASSAESLDLAHALQENLEHFAEVTVWNQGVFTPSKYTLDSLIDQLESTDFGVFVFAPDDIARIRGADRQVVRDNVVFELGLFIGRLGRERNFILIPKGAEEDFHLPSDLMGLTPARYEPNRQDENLVAALGPASTRIRRAMETLGILVQVNDAPSVSAPEDTSSVILSAVDKLAILESWMGKRPSSENTTVIYFAHVDRELSLPDGTTKALIKSAASRWNYVVQHEGDHTILFKNAPREPRRPRRTPFL